MIIRPIMNLIIHNNLLSCALERLLNAIAEIKQTLILKYRKQNVGESFEESDQQIERIYKHAISKYITASKTHSRTSGCKIHIIESPSHSNSRVYEICVNVCEIEKGRV